MKKIALIALALVLLLTATALADSWPTKDVNVIVPANAGGGTDIFTRRVADYLGRATGKNFVVLNVPEGSGMVGFEQTRNASM